MEISNRAQDSVKNYFCISDEERIVAEAHCAENQGAAAVGIAVLHELVIEILSERLPTGSELSRAAEEFERNQELARLMRALSDDNAVIPADQLGSLFKAYLHVRAAGCPNDVMTPQLLAARRLGARQCVLALMIFTRTGEITRDPHGVQGNYLEMRVSEMLRANGGFMAVLKRRCHQCFNTCARRARLVAAVLAIACAMLFAITAFRAPDDFYVRLRASDNALRNDPSSRTDALAKYSKALTLVPEIVEVAMHHSELYQLLRQWAKACHDFGEILRQRDPDYHKAFAITNETLKALGGLPAATIEHTALPVSWTSPRGDGGKLYLALKDSLRYLGSVRRWVELEPRVEQSNSSQPPLDRHGVMRACVASLYDVIQISHGYNVKMRLRRAECAVHAQMHEAASEEIRRILALEPKNVRAIALQALLFRSTGSDDKARAEIQRCLGLNSTYAPCVALEHAAKTNDAKLQAVTQLMYNKKYAEALVAADALLASDDLRYVNQLWSYKCAAFFDLGEILTGRAACSYVIEAAPNGSEEKRAAAQTALIGLCFIDGDLECAEREIKMATQANPLIELRVERERLRVLKIQRSDVESRLVDYCSLLRPDRHVDLAWIKRAFRNVTSLSPALM